MSDPHTIAVWRDRVRDGNQRAWLLILAMAVVVAFFILSGCTSFGRNQSRTSSQIQTNNAALLEESRALTTGAKDALDFAPTNAPVRTCPWAGLLKALALVCSMTTSFSGRKSCSSLMVPDGVWPVVPNTTIGAWTLFMRVSGMPRTAGRWSAARGYLLMKNPTSRQTLVDSEKDFARNSEKLAGLVKDAQQTATLRSLLP